MASCIQRAASGLGRTSWIMVLGFAAITAAPVAKAQVAPAKDAVPAAPAVSAAPAVAAKEAAEKAATAAVEAVEKNSKLLAESVEVREVKSYWLNLKAQPAPEPLRSQLKLDKTGLWIQQVGPGGAADKAGIKANDILVEIDGKPVAQVRDLERATAEGKAVSLKLLRAGEPVTLSVTPAVHETKRLAIAHRAPRVEIEEIEKIVREKLKEAGVDGLRMQFLQPGKFVPQGFSFNVASSLPDDLIVNVHKEGKKPAEVEVKRGDKTWNVKEDDLSSLPEDLRPHVEAMLGRGFPVKFGATYTPAARGGSGIAAGLGGSRAAPAAKVSEASRIEARAQERVEQRLREVDRRLETMHKQLDVMRKSLHARPTPDGGDKGVGKDGADKDDDDDDGDAGQQ
jgi:membrane-associated protease RseP (regulator of RpoE activity)